MDDLLKKEKITRFLNDKTMQEAVYRELLDSFMKKKDRSDIHLYAASRIAIDLLQEGWHNLEKIKDRQEVPKKEVKQIGL